MTSLWPLWTQSKDTIPTSWQGGLNIYPVICRTLFQRTQVLLLLPFMQTNAHFQDVSLTFLSLLHNWKKKKEYKLNPLLPHTCSLHLAVASDPFRLSPSSILGTHMDEEHEEIISDLAGLPHLFPGVRMHFSWNSRTEYCVGLTSSGEVNATFCFPHGSCVS